MKKNLRCFKCGKLGAREENQKVYSEGAQVRKINLCDKCFESDRINFEQEQKWRDIGMVV